MATIKLPDIQELNVLRKDVGERGFWDSLTTCIYCGLVSMLKVYPSGGAIAFYEDGWFETDGSVTPIATFSGVEKPGISLGS